MPSEKVAFTANKIDRGLNLQSNRNLSTEEISEGRSVRVEVGSGIFTGPGYMEMANLNTSAKGEGMYESRIFPALWVKSGTKIFFSEDPDSGKFYEIGLTATTGKYTAFLEHGNGDILITNETDSNVRVAVAKATVKIQDTDVVITVGANRIGKFAATGDVYVDGDEISYTGKSGTQLTGVTGIQSGGHAVNSLVMQTTNPTTWVEEKGKFLFELESRMIVGGRTDFEDILYASAPSTLANPEYFYDFDAHSPVSKTFHSKVVAGISGLGKSFVFASRGVWQLNGFDVTTGGWLVAPVSTTYGAYNERCVVDMDGVIAFFGNKRLMPITLRLQPDGSGGTFLEEKFDHRIRKWLDDLDDQEDQEDANLSYDTTQKVLKITARRGGALETYCYDMQANAFLPAESRPRGIHCMFDSKPYFVGNNGNVYRDDYGRSNGEIPIYHYWKTGRMEVEKGRKDIHLYQLEYDGYMSQACEHSLKTYIDGGTTPAFDKSYDDSIAELSIGIPIGSRGVGTSVIGGSNIGYVVHPFSNKILLRGLAGSDVALEWVTEKEGAFLQVNSFTLSAYPIRKSQGTYS